MTTLDKFNRFQMTKLTPPTKLKVWQLITRATWHGGNHADRDACIKELNRRGGWLNHQQIEQAGLTREEYRELCRQGDRENGIEPRY